MNAQYTHIQVDPSENCPMSAQQVYRNRGTPFRVSTVRIYEGEPEGSLCEVTGWSSEQGAVDAYAVEIEDSSEGIAYVVYGGDWGIRLRAVGNEGSWSLDDASQWGETHLVISDASDLS